VIRCKFCVLVCGIAKATHNSSCIRAHRHWTTPVNIQYSGSVGNREPWSLKREEMQMLELWTIV